jgi:hypothetical protein
VQKACKSSELFDNNGDKQEMAVNSGLAHGTGAKCLGVLKSERNTVECPQGSAFRNDPEGCCDDHNLFYYIDI